MPETKHMNEWTIIFLIYAELTKKNKQTKQQQELSNMLADLQQIHLKEGCKILILINRVFLEKKTENNSTFLWEVFRNTNDKANRFRAIDCEKTPFSMHKQEKTGDLLKNIHNNRYEAKGAITKGKKYLVITWGHGSAFGIFKRNTDSSKTFDILTNKALCAALQKGFEKKKVDVLLMYNCIMMNVHTCYSLKNAVDYLVAPQTMIEEPGFNYTEILNAVCKEASPEKIASACTNTLHNFSDINYKNKVEQWAVSSIQLGKFDAIILIIDKITRRLLHAIENNKRLRNTILTARNRCYQFDQSLNYHQVDFIHWLNELINQISNEENADVVLLKELISFQNIIRERVDNCVKAKSTGKFIYDKRLQAGMIKDEPSGLSIYFPKQNAALHNNYNYINRLIYRIRWQKSRQPKKLQQERLYSVAASKY